MKKILLALLCVLVLAVPTALANEHFSDVEEGTKEERIIEIMRALDIMVGYEDGTFGPQNSVTRAEFVTVIHNSIKYLNNVSADSDVVDESGFNWNAFYMNDGRGEYLELKYPQTEDSSGAEEGGIYKDVSTSHWAYQNIVNITTIGAVKGYGNGYFGPENTVTYDEAVKVILSLCGYDIYAQNNGGWPEGYTKLATRFGLNKGITATGTSAMSRIEVATLIYNAFMLELAPTEIDSNEDEKNFANDIMGVFILEGTLSATDITSIYGDEANKELIATVGDVDFSFSEESDIRNYIGRSVRVFLTEVDEDTYQMKCFELTTKDEIVEIPISLFIDYSGGRINYYKSDDKDKETKTDARDGSVVIYNGKCVPEYGKEIFEGLNQGTITVIKKKDFDFDVIVIENFESGYAEKINVKSTEITDSLKSGTGENSLIKLKSDDETSKIIYQIFDAEGNTITFDKLKAGAINYYVNDGYIKIYFSDKKVSGKISSTYTEEGKTYLGIDGVSYPVSNAYATYLGTISKQGIESNLYIDSFGEIVWMSDNTNLDGYVYFVKAKQDIENDCLLITYFDINSALIKERVQTADEIKYVDKYGQSSKRSASGVYSELESYDGLLKLTLNEEEKISKIEMPLDKSVDKGDKLKLILESNNDSNSPNYKDNFSYGADSFSGQVYTNSNTIVITTPADKEQYDYYAVKTYKTLTYKNATLFKLYSFDVNSPYAKVVVTTQESTAPEQIFNQVPFYFVTNMKVSVYNTGEYTTECDLFNLQDGSSKKVSVVTDTEKTPFTGETWDATMVKSNLSVGKGDIIQLEEDSNDGTIVGVRIIYDADAVNPAWCMGDNVNKPTKCTHSDEEHTTALRGAIVGTSGYNEHSKHYCNPIGYTNGDVSVYGRGPADNSWVWQMFTDGYVYTIREGLLRITTQNLREGFAGEDGDYYWKYDSVERQGAKIFVVENKDGEYAITSGTVDDIHTYEQVGRECDRIFTYHYHGGMKSLLVFKD